MKPSKTPARKYLVLGVLAIIVGALDPIDFLPRLPFLAVAMTGTGVVVLTTYLFCRGHARTPGPETAIG